MQVIGPLVFLTLLAALEVLAYLGVRLALRADGHRRRAVVIAMLYWLTTAVTVGAIIAAASFGPRDADGERQIPGVAIVALAAVYLPKFPLAALTLIDLVRRALARTARRVLARGTPAAAASPVRSRLLPRLGFVLAALTLGAVAWGATAGRADVAVYRHTIVSESLPAAFDGLRIVHLSDIHASSLGTHAARLADRMAAAVSAEKPDLVVYTGDYGEPADFERGPNILGRLPARLGKFAVLGNHDFGGRERAADNWTSPEDKQRKVDRLARAFGARGFTLLANDASTVATDRGGIAVLGVGVHDPHHGFDDADLAACERAAGTAAFRLLIAHSPQYWETAVLGRSPIELTLVGHTHGAQVGVGIAPLVWSPAALEYRHWGGLYREGGQYLNVNRGTGFVGLPLRLNMPADVSVIVVRSRHATRPERTS